jgi:polyisoprenoid-binding protein YceI
MKHLAIALAALAALGSTRAEPATYAIDPTHTFVGYEASHFGTSTSRGRWDRKTGTVTLDLAARTGRVEITIDMASINSGVPALDRNLRGKDFFNVTEHPSASFVGHGLRFEGDKITAVEGTLTLMGQTRPLVLKATHYNCYTNPILKREVCGGDFVATLQPSAFGITAYLPQVTPDEVRLVVQVEAIRQ